jgi:hypothetical protein
LNGSSILDLAPTILSYFGITPPGYMTGKVREELGSGSNKSNEPLTSSAAPSLQSTA